MQGLSPEAWIALAVAVGGFVIIGTLVTGLITLSGFALVVMQIWQMIRPKTDGFASNEYVRSVESRSDERHKQNTDSIQRNYDHSENRFREVLTKVEDVGRQVTELSEPLFKIVGKIEKNAPITRVKK